jgi:hypothetical protein
MLRFHRRRPSPATVIALIALFVALGGPAQAAKLIRGSQIKSSTLTSKHIKNRSLRSVDLSRSTVRDLQRTLPGTIDGASVRDGSLSGADIFDRTVVNADLAPNSVGPGKILTNAVTASELADNAVDSAAVLDGSLAAKDIARFSGTFNLAVPTLQPEQCFGATPDGLIPTNTELQSDLIIGTPPADWPDALTFTIHRAASVANKFRVAICNASNVPTPAGGGLFRYAVLGI